MPWWSVTKSDNLGDAENRFGTEAFALTCLALELAKADDDFDIQERSRLSADLAHHFDLNDEEVGALMDAAEAYQRQSVETYSFTRKLRESLDIDDRVVVIETLWRLAYANAVLDAEEFAFMRTIPSALGVDNHISETAKRRALNALGLADDLS